MVRLNPICSLCRLTTLFQQWGALYEILIAPRELQLPNRLSALSAIPADIDCESVHLVTRGKGEHIVCKASRDDFSANLATGTVEQEDSFDSCFMTGPATVLIIWEVDNCVGWEAGVVDGVTHLERETSDEGTWRHAAAG